MNRSARKRRNGTHPALQSGPISGNSLEARGRCARRLREDDHLGERRRAKGLGRNALEESHGGRSAHCHLACRPCGFRRIRCRAEGFSDRVINVGVAEANMVMMAAGMRQTGLLPVTYTFAAFGTNEARANARLIDINTGHTRSAVIHDCTHVGLSVGEDGETHQEQNYLNIPFHHTQVWMLADSNQAAAAAERAMELSAEGRTSVYIFHRAADILSYFLFQASRSTGSTMSLTEQPTLSAGGAPQRTLRPSSLPEPPSMMRFWQPISF